MYGYTHDKDSYIRRLRRIEGQIRGLQRMVEHDQYCIDILTQVAVATKALQSVALAPLEEHLGLCVVQAVAGSRMPGTGPVSPGSIPRCSGPAHGRPRRKRRRLPEARR